MAEKYTVIYDDDLLSWDEMTTDEEPTPESETGNETGTESDVETIETVEDLRADYLKFTDDNPTTFHVVSYFKKLLDDHGFEFIDEQKPVTPELKEKLKNGGFFYTTRGDLTILPFVIGGKWKPENGVGGVGSHIDALTLKLKPSSLEPKKDGYEQLGVASYATSFQYLRLDRDYGIGGTILVREGDGFVRKLVKSDFPVAKIPSLAPHFGVHGRYNEETQMVPITGFDTSPEEKIDHPLSGRHSAKLLKFISQISDVKLEDIIELELEIFDVEKATVGGLRDEFIFAPRLDDRLCSWTAILGLIEASKSLTPETIKEFTGLNLVLLVDNEEIGSNSRTGAQGKFLNATIDKILAIRDEGNVSSLVYANSILLSADVTHLLNPNFKSAYLPKHYPLPNTGMTIKMDANGHVMSDYAGYNMLKTITSKNGLKLQQFHIRNDARSGGTIGPYLASATGSRVIDIGLPIMSMHSVRAMCGSKEVDIGVDFFGAFFSDWRAEYDKYKGL